MLVPMFCRTSVFPLLCAALLSLSSVPSAVGAENFPSQKIGGPGMYFPVFGLLCGTV